MDPWQRGFCLADDMRPPFIDRNLAEKILRAGDFTCLMAGHVRCNPRGRSV